MTRKNAAQYNMNKHSISELESQPFQNGNFFIPDLCQVNSVLFLVILTELLALVFALMHNAQQLIDWDYLGLVSLFSQSIVLTSAAVICLSKKILTSKSVKVVALYFMAIIIGITSLYSGICVTFLAGIVVGDAMQFMFRNILVSGIFGGLLVRYFYLQFQWREQKQAELRARLEALQARIRPHFLFNSMNTIASLITIDPHQAEEAVLDLSTLFRATLNNQSMLISLEDEISLCRRYLNIEGLRLGKRLKVEWQLDGYNGEVKIPPLTLQPLVENAIYHGIQPRTEGGTVTIQSYCKQDTVYVLISNPFDLDQQTKHGNQIALENIRSRMSAIFDHAAVLKTSQLDNIFTVTLRFPMS